MNPMKLLSKIVASAVLFAVLGSLVPGFRFAEPTPAHADVPTIDLGVITIDTADLILQIENFAQHILEYVEKFL